MYLLLSTDSHDAHDERNLVRLVMILNAIPNLKGNYHDHWATARFGLRCSGDFTSCRLNQESRSDRDGASPRKMAASRSNRDRFRRLYIELPTTGRTGPVDTKGTLEISLSVPLEVTSMAKVPAIIPVTDLRQDAAAALKHVKSTRQPVVITQRGRAAAVLVSMEAYERSEHERQLLHLLARGEQEITAGRGFDLDEVLAEADAFLAGGPK